VKNCKVASNTAALKFGSSSQGGFIDIRVSNCYFYDCPMGAMKLALVDGGRLENVEISRIVMKNVGCPLFIRLGNRASTFGQGGMAPVGTVKNIRIHDVVAEVAVEDREQAASAPYKGIKVDRTPGVTDDEKAKAGPIMISGIPGHAVENVVLENIEISFPGFGNSKEAQRDVAEDVDRYPEQYFFGVLPSWGAYIRHAKNVEFKNVKLTTRSPDARKPIVTVDVDGFVAD
jgi:polygalacturonase